MSNQIKTRMSQKHDIQANWEKAVNFIPLAGEIVFYDPDGSVGFTRMKVGDGVTVVSELPFFTPQVTTEDIMHSQTSQVLSAILSSYVLEIDYENTLAFDVKENIFAEEPEEPEEEQKYTAILGFATLGQMILGKN